MKEHFRHFAHYVADLAGTSWCFILAIVTVIAWALSGPYFEYSDTWQLVINTSTTIVTFLMVFLIQNSQNRDTLAVQLKLDELIRSVHAAHNSMIDLDKLSDDELRQLHGRYQELCKAESPATEIPQAIPSGSQRTVKK